MTLPTMQIEVFSQFVQRYFGARLVGDDAFRERSRKSSGELWRYAVSGIKLVLIRQIVPGEDGDMVEVSYTDRELGAQIEKLWDTFLLSLTQESSNERDTGSNA